MKTFFSTNVLDLDLAPEVSASESVTLRLSQTSFHQLMDRIATHYGLLIRKLKGDSCEFQFPGSTFASPDSLNILFGLAPDPKHYRGLKSTLRVNREAEGLHLYAYEHLLGSRSEQDAYREVLQDRINIFKRYIRHELPLNPSHV